MFNISLLLPAIVLISMQANNALWMVCNNLTSIELKELENDFAFFDNFETKNMYDVGLIGNLNSVMGVKWYLWLLPLPFDYYGVEGDGHSFKLKFKEC